MCTNALKAKSTKYITVHVIFSFKFFFVYVDTKYKIHTRLFPAHTTCVRYYDRGYICLSLLNSPMTSMELYSFSSGDNTETRRNEGTGARSRSKGQSGLQAHAD